MEKQWEFLDLNRNRASSRSRLKLENTLKLDESGAVKGRGLLYWRFMATSPGIRLNFLAHLIIFDSYIS